MENTFWHKQTSDNPLFPDLLWNRPENRNQAGKLLIIGGNSGGFKAPADAYRYAVKAGIGTARILLPDSLRKIIGEVFLEMGEYAPSTPSGSFKYQSFAEFMAHSHWADGVLLAGDFGRNSETAQLLEYYITKFSGQLTITGDALDFFLDSPRVLTERPHTVIACSAQQLQKIASNSATLSAFTSTMSMQNFAETLYEFGTSHSASWVTNHLNHTFVTAERRISSTVTAGSMIKLSASAAVWILQHPGRPFKAVTTSLL